MADLKRRALTFAVLSAGAACAGVLLKPHARTADAVRIDLDRQVPRQFADWRVDGSIVPVLPNPEVQAKLDAIYTQVLARTYVNSQGERVMLSIAYGSDQASEATAAHRPEFCYSAQGFAVRHVADQVVQVPEGGVPVRRLFGSLGSRDEPITYWVTLNDRAMLPGVQRKVEQIRLGLKGLIPDGMLVRVSTLNGDIGKGFALQDKFLVALDGSLSPAIRPRYFGHSNT